MNRITEKIRELGGFQSLLAQLEGEKEIEPLSLSRAARLPVTAALHDHTQRIILLITHRADRALSLVDELSLWAPKARRMYFAEPSGLFYENVAWGKRTRQERLAVLTHVASRHIPRSDPYAGQAIIISSARALMARSMPKHEFLKATKVLRMGQQIEPAELAKHLVEKGYTSASTVVVPGQFARRGGILDVWPPQAAQPTRLEYFGDEIDSFRHFNPASQRTTLEHHELLLPPSREFLHTRIEAVEIQEGEKLSEFHIPILHPSPAGLLDYLPSTALVLFDDWEAIEESIYEQEQQAVGLRKDYIGEDSLPEDFPIPYLSLDAIQDRLARHQCVELGPVADLEANDLTQAFRPGQRFGGRLKPLMDRLAQFYDHGETVSVVSRQAARLKELWGERVIEIDDQAPDFIQGSLAEGFELHTMQGPRHHLLSDGEIFGWSRPQPRQRPQVKREAPESLYAEFRINELVVHIDHGIGRFKGLVTREIEGIDHEYLNVEYGDGDQLYVPIHQADRLTKYVGTKGHRPQLNRLGGVQWRQVTSRVKAAVAEVADELLELYAKRHVSQGTSYNPDTEWQRELEASFPYIETADQLRVINEVKSDMEIARPMDRLICGDVGYGKTEVALRAAFKAVMDGKQVALLVPTTILAQQHFNTFLQRLAAFPAEVEMLSRFRTPHEQREILYQLAQGTIDIIIGTHRLIQPDVQFKELGLLIIDEEQRFGVTHKEFLKQMRTEVDVLTMTATPIPRTLYMALTGVRDISTINTPPEERLPIRTHVGPYSGKRVRQAILRELERGGQVFFVHNRVQTIESMHQRLARIVPEARIGVAHGQMPEKALAERMRGFTAHDIDVLLTTTIIESGLDIPNANTLIVDRADTFGLAQLYQLRGRVGRGAMRAYAYFFRHPRKFPTEEGRKRLETIAENTQLGAGFSIAMRDLEIRGAGDILGTRQHGHIAAVGYHLYTRLLAQAVKQVREQGGVQTDPVAANLSLIHPMINVDLPIAVTIPDHYVPDKTMRLRLYRRLADIHDLDEIEALHEEFSDRFGKPPKPVLNMFYQLRIKLLAEDAGLESVTFENRQIALRFPDLPHEAPPRHFPAMPHVRTSKNTVWLTQSELWQTQLVETLKSLGEQSGVRPVRS